MRTLLIVDDHESVLHTLDYVFGLRGYRVLTANSGKAAVEIARNEIFDVALVALHMPVMDGFQTCTALLALGRENGRNFPIWLMTAAFTSAAQRRAVEVGAVTLLSKPFNHEDFIVAVEKRLTEPQQQDPSALANAQPPRLTQ